MILRATPLPPAAGWIRQVPPFAAKCRPRHVFFVVLPFDSFLSRAMCGALHMPPPIAHTHTLTATPTSRDCLRREISEGGNSCRATPAGREFGRWIPPGTQRYVDTETRSRKICDSAPTRCDFSHFRSPAHTCFRLSAIFLLFLRVAAFFTDMRPAFFTNSETVTLLTLIWSAILDSVGDPPWSI